VSKRGIMTRRRSGSIAGAHAAFNFILQVCLFIAMAARLAAAQLPSTVTLSSSPNASTYGSPVTLIATVSPSTASGSITFFSGVTPVATVPVSNGQAKYSTSLLTAGADPLRAYYGGDNNYSPSSASTIQNVQAQRGGAFQAPHNEGVGYLPWSLTVADFNEDGKPDIAVAFNGSDSIVVSLGNGDGSFQVPITYPGVVNPRWVITGDFNGDGHADLAAANIGGDSVSVFLGNGDGSFRPAKTYGTGSKSNPYALVVADFNGDGKADLAVTDDGAEANTVTVLLGNGDGSFKALPPVACGGDPRSIAAGDFNGDGATDLVVGNYTDSTVTVLLGKGDGTFQPGRPYAVASAGDRSTTTNPRSIAVGDFNGDGSMDLAVANQNTGTVDVLLGRGDGSFSSSQSACSTCTGTAAFVDEPYSVAAADVDGDNILDLVTANYGSASVTLLRGNGNGQFTPVDSFAADANPVWVAVASFAGNGMADVVTANYGGNSFSILSGTTPAPDLSISWSIQSVSQATFTTTIRKIGLSPSAGAVTVTITLLAGVTAAQLQGAGWSCSAATLTCSRNDPLQAISSYPAISLSLAFSSTAPPGITLSASVSGGGDINPSNNSAREYVTTFSSTAVSNAWSQLNTSNHPLPSGLTSVDAPLLMTDGSVLIHQLCSGNWYKLTPDSTTGSYAAGKWSQIASMPSGYAPLYFASAVLPDGRLVVIGGEYNGGGCTDHIETTLGAIYDPVADAWTSLNGPGTWSEVGDAPSAILPDGRFVLGQITGKGMAALDPRTLAWTALKSNGKADNNSEEGWTLLPDGSLLTVDVTNAGQSERYFPSTDTWTLGGNTVVPLVTGREMGPQVLLPNGSVFVAGANGHTSLYDSIRPVERRLVGRSRLPRRSEWPFVDGRRPGRSFTRRQRTSRSQCLFPEFSRAVSVSRLLL
jgi:hypothetical protein